MGPDRPTSPGAPAAGAPTDFQSAGGDVPTFELPVPVPRPPDPAAALAALGPGHRLGDFDLDRELGAGAFARVFLARQSSLGRVVALKVTAHRLGEARTLAGLEHDHIVRVFSEDGAESGLRLLCMQYVPGLTLQRLMAELAARGPGWTGRDLLDVLDRSAIEPVALDPAALRERELLAQSDGPEVVCWMGARLAEALAHAHDKGVLHRDIKPANILVNRYGRPPLADFNMASDARDDGGAFGGTVGYMAPEHLDALDPAHPAGPDVVDRRSDVYALGLVLFELLAGRRPWDAPAGGYRAADLPALAARRRAGAPSVAAYRPDVPTVLDRAVRRCLEPDPAARYQSAADLAESLDGCRDWRRADRAMPSPDRVTRAARRFPLLMGVTLPILPHLAGSAAHIGYNRVRLRAEVGEGSFQGEMLTALGVGYAASVFLVTGVAAYLLTRPIARALWLLRAGAGDIEPRVAAARRYALRVPLISLGLSALGWVPGMFLTPLALHLIAGPVGREVFAHFAVSFALAGFIALPYNLFAAQFLVLRGAYPVCWADARRFREQAGRELAGEARRVRRFRWLACLVPLAAAGLLAGASPEQFTPGFRLLMSALVVSGVAGIALALAVGDQLNLTLNALAGSPRPAGDPAPAGSAGPPTDPGE